MKHEMIKARMEAEAIIAIATTNANGKRRRWKRISDCWAKSFL
jgi:hypothetical protein